MTYDCHVVLQTKPRDKAQALLYLMNRVLLESLQISLVVPNVVDHKTLCERNGCTPPQFIRRYTNLFHIADGEDCMIPTLTLKTSVVYKSMGDLCVEVTDSYVDLRKI